MLQKINGGGTVLELRNIIDTRRRGEPDLALFAAIFALAGIGLAMSYSASAVYAYRVFGDSFYFLKRQAVWFLVGFAALMIFQSIDYREYVKHTRIMLGAAFILLILVLIPGVGSAAKGSSRWLSLGFVGVQPSEFAKVICVIYLVKIYSSGARVNHVMQLLIPMLVIALIFVLVMLQPDFGTAMDLLLVSVFIIFVSGFPLTYIIFLFILSIPMFYLLIYQVSYRWDRVLAYIDPWSDRYGIGYHVIQSFTAFKKGGLLGVGLGFGTQKITRLPEPHTDFIFAVIGEEAGLIGTVSLVLLFCFVFWRGILIALGAPDGFGKLLAVGLSLLIVVQAFVNMGVVSGSLPTTGIPLPFISYGGSSLLTSMIASGILLNISRYREAAFREVKFEEVWSNE
ncbi:MAG TPA: putative lipid II flippase FtsW [Spirochaetota bacterium]|nr:putative lipid II flippase FtsW [Spirochaetota bacterium]HPJ35871.1 putative lipid II flippase FtsW [Spirochaetota bacterium]